MLGEVLGKEIKEDTVLSTELEYEPAETDYEAFVKEALLNRPETEEIELQEQMSKTLLSLARASNKPNLVLTGNLDYIQGMDEFKDTSFKMGDFYRTWNARLVLNFPFFNGFSTMGKVKKAKAQLSQVRIAREQLFNGIKLEIKQTCFNINHSGEMILAQKENIEMARDNLEVAQQRYKQGLVSDIEVRDAQLALTQAEVNYYQALYDYNVARAGLDKALGR